MRILHLCLSNFYIDNYAYQENLLPRQNKLDGHDVQIIASCETYVDNKSLGYVSPRQYVTEDEIPIVRLPYRRILPRFVMKKLRMHSGVFRLLEEFKPDVILFHSLCGWELITAVKYKKRNPHVKLYADSHEDMSNSARNFISRNILHKLYYRSIVRYALPYIAKVLYISLGTRDFIIDMYGIPESAMEFFPLGGTVYPDNVYKEKRARMRNNLGLSENDILIIQAGKMGREKKLLESIRAFKERNRKNLRLVIIGSLDDEICDEVQFLLAGSKTISYLGWKESAELMEYLCAADVYLQPGSQSAIMQNALCLRCPVILDDIFSHKPFVQGNGWLLNASKSISDALNEVSQDQGQLKNMSLCSLKIARELLDYKKLAARIYV